MARPAGALHEYIVMAFGNLDNYASKNELLDDSDQAWSWLARLHV